MTGNATQTVEVFEYPASPGEAPVVTDWLGADEECGEGAREAQAEIAEKAAQSSFEAGRERGVAEGRAAEREAVARQRTAEEQQRRQHWAQMAQNIAEERDRYLNRVEQEVVQLALAIAARILRREAQMDPLLLTGAVRVALGQLTETSEVRLLVPEAELSLWRETIAHLPNLPLRPVVVAGEGMRVGDCRIESELGGVDLGVRSQLGEIERGFFDRAHGAGTGKAPANAVLSGEAEQ